MMTGHSLVETFLTVFDRDGLLKLHAAGPITPPPQMGKVRPGLGWGGGFSPSPWKDSPAALYSALYSDPEATAGGRQDSKLQPTAPQVLTVRAGTLRYPLPAHAGKPLQAISQLLDAHFTHLKQACLQFWEFLKLWERH